MQVFILVYEHRHGVDVSAFSTEKSALVSAAVLCCENVHSTELDAYASTEAVKLNIFQIVGTVPVNDWDVGIAQKIIGAYHAGEFGETFEVCPRPLD